MGPEKRMRVLTEFDLHLIGEGSHYKNYEKLGSHVREIEGVKGVHFAVWAPNAEAVSVIGDFNHWNPENDLLKKGDDGIWRLRKRIPTGMYRYRYIIDGAWQPDIYNPLSGSDDTGEICSILKIEE